MKSITLSLLSLSLLLSSCSSEPKKLPYTLEITPKGIGLITNKTPFNLSMIDSKLLGFELQKFTSFEAGIPHPVIRVTHNNKEIMLIHPTNDLESIAAISIISKDVTNKYGTIGMTFETFKKNGPSCTPNINNTSTCKLEQNSALEYLFDNNILKEIIWSASL